MVALVDAMVNVQMRTNGSSNDGHRSKWKKNLFYVFCTTENEIFVMVTVQSILLIPLKVKL